MPCGLCGRHRNRLVRFDGNRNILTGFLRLSHECLVHHTCHSKVANRICLAFNSAFFKKAGYDICFRTWFIRVTYACVHAIGLKLGQVWVLESVGVRAGAARRPRGE
jgi:hypothetical protein